MKLVVFLAVSLAGLASAVSLAAEGPVLDAVKGKLVESEGKKLKPHDDAALGQAKYFGIYYSASWCGPCREFTPKLVRWYKSNKKKNPHFELIFVSSDRTEEAMADYMKEYKMEFPALAFDQKSSSKGITKFSSGGIPNLVFVNADGTVISSSYVDKEYVGPVKVLDDIEKTLKDDPAPAEAIAAASSTATKTGSSSFDDFFKKKPEGE